MGTRWTGDEKHRVSIRARGVGRRRRRARSIADLIPDRKKRFAFSEETRAVARALIRFARARSGGRAGAEGEGEGETHLEVVTV